MRYIILILFSFAIFSCNNSDERVDMPAKAPETSPEETLRAAAVKYPDSVLLLQKLLEYYTDTENYDAAVSTVDQSIKRDSSNPEVWDLRSVVYAMKGDTAQAIHSLEKAIDIIPLPSYIISLGALYAETKNPAALEMADALLVGNKSRAEKEAYFIKGLYYSFSNQKEKALPFFDDAISKDYTFMDAYLEKAIALYDLNKYEAAVEVLKRAVTLQNNYDKGYYYLGQCYEKLGRKEDAVNAYRTALMYDPEYIEAKDALDKMGIK